MMQETPPSTDVTVVIPTRDRTTYLGFAIDSVLAQTRPPSRLVVVDNSQKNAAAVRELCESYGDGVVEYLPPLRDLSFNENHQRALSAATTPLVCVMQDDDVYRPTFMERAVAALNAEPRASIFAVNYAVLDSDGHEIQDRAWTLFPAGTLSSADFVAHVISHMSPVHLSASMFRREAACSAAFYEQDAMASDIGFFLRVACAGPVILLDEPLSAIRTHNQTESSKQGWMYGSASHTSSMIPLEWGVKDRFLQSVPAKTVLGDRLNSVRGQGAARALDLYKGVIRQSDSSKAERVACGRFAVQLFFDELRRKARR